ncbi:MAG: Uma2 family endonuclease [Desulfobacterales bacterium]|nr:Uma2 family endonuclease [Desulfobacterales bacterium]
MTQPMRQVDIQEDEWEDDLSHPLEKLNVSEEEYWEKYYENSDIKCEWNNGYLEEKPMTDPASYLMFEWFTDVLKFFLKTNPIGITMGLEFGFRLALPYKTTIRKPDMAVILNNNPIRLSMNDRSFSGVFDVCVESLSDSKPQEIIRDVMIKKEEYERIGVKEYYILDAKGKNTAFYKRRNQRYVPIPIKKNIIQSQVLPGFQFRISDLWDRPTLEKMVEDEVYRGFVVPFYQEEKKRAEHERQRAEHETQRAEQAERQLEQERHLSESLRLMLKNLGIEI